MISIDRLAYDIVVRHRGRVTVADNEVLDQLWESAAKQAPTFLNRAGQVSTFSAAFLRREWEQVVLAQRLHHPGGVPGGVPARSRRRPARRAARAGVGRDRLGGARTGAAAAAHPHPARRRRRRDRPPRAGRRTGTSSWTRGRTCTRRSGGCCGPWSNPDPNDMFLLADPYQRIYDSHVSLAQLGIEVRGRTRRLTLNYRTTHEILDLSVRVPQRRRRPSASTGRRTRCGATAAVTRGAVPDARRPRQPRRRVRGADRTGRDLARRRAWSRTPSAWPPAPGSSSRSISRILGEAHIPVADEKRGVDGVRVGHDAPDEGPGVPVPRGRRPGRGPAAGTPRDHLGGRGPARPRQDLQRERCLLFVAMTRARDVLYLSHSGSPSPLLPVARDERARRRRPETGRRGTLRLGQDRPHRHLPGGLAAAVAAPGRHRRRGRAALGPLARPAVRHRIADELPGGEADGRTLAVWLAGVHDIGKATPAFAVQAPRLADRMRDHGLGYDRNLIRADRRYAPHATAGHLCWPTGCTSRAGRTRTRSPSSSAATTACRRPTRASASVQLTPAPARRATAWRQVQQELLTWMARAVGRRRAARRLERRGAVAARAGHPHRARHRRRLDRQQRGVLPVRSWTAPTPTGCRSGWEMLDLPRTRGEPRRAAGERGRAVRPARFALPAVRAHVRCSGPSPSWPRRCPRPA